MDAITWLDIVQHAVVAPGHDVWIRRLDDTLCIAVRAHEVVIYVTGDLAYIGVGQEPYKISAEVGGISRSLITTVPLSYDTAVGIAHSVLGNSRSTFARG